jgi:hypothetical protein
MRPSRPNRKLPMNSEIWGPDEPYISGKTDEEWDQFYDNRYYLLRIRVLANDLYPRRVDDIMYDIVDNYNNCFGKYDVNSFANVMAALAIVDTKVNDQYVHDNIMKFRDIHEPK